MDDFSRARSRLSSRAISRSYHYSGSRSRYRSRTNSWSMCGGARNYLGLYPSTLSSNRVSTGPYHYGITQSSTRNFDPCVHSPLSSYGGHPARRPLWTRSMPRVANSASARRSYRRAHSGCALSGRRRRHRTPNLVRQRSVESSQKSHPIHRQVSRSRDGSYHKCPKRSHP